MNVEEKPSTLTYKLTKLRCDITLHYQYVLNTLYLCEVPDFVGLTEERKEEKRALMVSSRKVEVQFKI